MTEHPVELLEQYALRLLPPDALASVAEHVARCSECQLELSEIEQTLGLLAYAAPLLQPPAGAEERLFARLSTIRATERPTATSAAPSPTAAPAGRQPTTGVLVPFGARWDASLRSVQSRMRRTSAVVYGLAAAIAILLVSVGVLGGAVGASQRDNARLSAQTQAQAAALAVVNAPDAIVRSLTPTERAAAGAQVKMAMDPRTRSGVLIVAHLAPLPADKTYELWLVQPQHTGGPLTTTPAGTFTVARDGSAIVQFHAGVPISDVHDAGVSIERAPGVQTPQSPMILLLSA